MREGTANIIAGSFIILFGTLLLLETTSSQYATEGEGIGTGPAFFPQVLLLVILFTGIVTLINGVKIRGAALPQINKKRLVTIVILTAVLFFSFSQLGFLFSAFPFLVLAMWRMGLKNKSLLLVIPFLVSVGCWYFFNFVFEILLPTSPWFVFI